MTNDGNIHQPTPVYKISKQFGHKYVEREELHVEQKSIISESYGVIFLNVNTHVTTRN